MPPTLWLCVCFYLLSACSAKPTHWHQDLTKKHENSVLQEQAIDQKKHENSNFDEEKFKELKRSTRQITANNFFGTSISVGGPSNFNNHPQFPFPERQKLGLPLNQQQYGPPGLHPIGQLGATLQNIIGSHLEATVQLNKAVHGTIDKVFNHLPPLQPSCSLCNPHTQTHSFGETIPHTHSSGETIPHTHSFGEVIPHSHSFGETIPHTYSSGEIIPHTHSFGGTIPHTHSFGEASQHTQSFGETSYYTHSFGEASHYLGFGRPQIIPSGVHIEQVGIPCSEGGIGCQDIPKQIHSITEEPFSSSTEIIKVIPEIQPSAAPTINTEQQEFGNGNDSDIVYENDKDPKTLGSNNGSGIDIRFGNGSSEDQLPSKN